MGWPQVIWLATEILGVYIHLVRHGEKEKKEYNFFVRLFVAGINLWVLKAGGFFG